MSLSERTQVLLSPQQRDRLEATARRRGVSVGAVVREAINAYLESPNRSRRSALADLFSMETPVDAWPVMKDEIERGALS
ncbi:MAG: CopG family transcriptional regulator [Acidimicrobiales bacterium]